MTDRNGQNASMTATVRTPLHAERAPGYAIARVRRTLAFSAPGLSKRAALLPVCPVSGREAVAAHLSCVSTIQGIILVPGLPALTAARPPRAKATSEFVGGTIWGRLTCYVAVAALHT